MVVASRPSRIVYEREGVGESGDHRAPDEKEAKSARSPKISLQKFPSSIFPGVHLLAALLLLLLLSAELKFIHRARQFISMPSGSHVSCVLRTHYRHSFVARSTITVRPLFAAIIYSFPASAEGCLAATFGLARSNRIDTNR